MAACKERTHGQEAVTTLLPLLLDDALISSVKAVKAVGLSVLVEISKEAGPALKPHVATLIATLLEALSGTESGQLDYLANLLNSDSVSNIVDDVRTSMQAQSPLTACLNDCVGHVDGSVLPELVPKLVSLFKSGLGASTRIGCARVCAALVRQCRDELTPFGGKLLKSLAQAAMCKSAPLQREFALAFAAVSRVATDVCPCYLYRLSYGCIVVFAD